MFWLGMFVLGTGVGIVSAGLGLGGGILMVPAFLEFVPGIDPGTAKGTSLFIIIFVAAVNTWRLNHGHEDWQWSTAVFIAMGSIVGAYASGWATSLMPDKVVLCIFVGLIGIAALRTFLMPPILVLEEDVRRRRYTSLLIGLATGVVSGATGVGGGAVLVPLALLAGIAPNARVVALSNMVMVATCISGTLAHALAPQTADLAWTYGQVSIALAPAVFLGAQLGAPLGKRLNDALSLPRRKIVMGVLLLVIAVRLLGRILGG